MAANSSVSRVSKSMKSAWLDKETHVGMIQSRLSGVRVPAIMKELTEPYAQKSDQAGK